MNITYTIKLRGFAFDREVFLNGKQLSARKSQQVRNHSPDGFNWGYGGSGPAQLALAICLELMDKETAIANYQDVKFKHIAALPQGENFDVEIVIEIKK